MKENNFKKSKLKRRINGLNKESNPFEV